MNILRTEHLKKTFPEATSGQDSCVLDDINISIEQGETYGIIGRSGAGKSTLVRCINFLERPTGGEVYFEGKAMSALPKAGLYKTRQSMGMIFQQFNLLEQRTALKNVRYPMEIAGWSKKDADARAEELLELVNMGDKKKSYPSQLSGGQRQRVAIARAIALNPKVLLCDEATSALDPETTKGVLDLLNEINRKYGITIVIITHEMSVIEYICDRVAILDDSRVVEEGPVLSILKNPQSETGKSFVKPEFRRIRG
jgi:D-methionine transport system ATP-binding protein